MKKTNVYYDNRLDSIYIMLRSGKEESFEEVQPNMVVEYDKHGKPIGIEILKASTTLINKIRPRVSQNRNETTVFSSSAK